MNTQLHNTYQTHQRQDETLRETEAHALLSCASRLEAARQPDSSKEEFGEALRHNQHLWTIFQAGICDPENQLPRDLKVLLLNLSRYVDKVTFRALAETNRNLLRSLININRTLASGLRKGAQEPKAVQTAAPPPVQTGDGAKTVITSA